MWIVNIVYKKLLPWKQLLNSSLYKDISGQFMQLILFIKNVAMETV